MAALEPTLQQHAHALYSAHHGWLFAWLRRKLGCGHQAADVAHDTFLRLLGSPVLSSTLQEPRAYLVTTAKRVLIDEARRQQIAAAYLKALATVAPLEGAPSAEQVVQTVQALVRIEAALQNLSEKARQAFLMHYLEGASHGEIATALGVSTRMVHKYLVQALVCCHQAVDA